MNAPEAPSLLGDSTIRRRFPRDPISLSVTDVSAQLHLKLLKCIRLPTPFPFPLGEVD